MAKQPKSIIAYKLCSKRDGFYKSYNLPSAEDAVIYEEGKTTYPLKGYNQFLFVFKSLQDVFNFLSDENFDLIKFQDRFSNLGLFKVKAYNPTQRAKIVHGYRQGEIFSVGPWKEEVWLCSHMDVLKRLA